MVVRDARGPQADSTAHVRFGSLRPTRATSLCGRIAREERLAGADRSPTAYHEQRGVFFQKFRRREKTGNLGRFPRARRDRGASAGLGRNFGVGGGRERVFAAAEAARLREERATEGQFAVGSGHTAVEDFSHFTERHQEEIAVPQYRGGLRPALLESLHFFRKARDQLTFDDRSEESLLSSNLFQGDLPDRSPPQPIDQKPMHHLRRHVEHVATRRELGIDLPQHPCKGFMSKIGRPKTF